MDGLPLLSANLGVTAQMYLTILTEELRKSGLTIPQLLVLDQVKESPKTIGEISHLIDLSYSTVSGIVDRLERSGMVYRKRDEKDRRVVWVAVDETAQCKAEQIPVFQAEYYRELFHGMTSEDIETISNSLQKLNQYLVKKRDALWRERGSERK